MTIEAPVWDLEDPRLDMFTKEDKMPVQALFLTARVHSSKVANSVENLVLALHELLDPDKIRHTQVDAVEMEGGDVINLDQDTLIFSLGYEKVSSKVVILNLSANSNTPTVH